MTTLTLIFLLIVALVVQSLPTEEPKMQGAPFNYFITHMDLQLTNHATKQALSVPLNVAIQGKDLWMRAPGAYPSQTFHMRAVDATSTYIIHPHSGLYAQFMPASQMIHLGTNTANSLSFWKITFNGKGHYLINNVNNGLYLTAWKDLPRNDIDSSGPVYLSKVETNNTFQEWSIHEQQMELENELPEVKALNCTC